MRRYSNAPVGNTCPMIDEVIRFIDNHTVEDIDVKDFKEVLDTMEKIRSANQALRSWGEGLDEKADELESDMSNLEKKIDRLEADMVYYEKENRDLQREIDLLQDKLVEVTC